MLGQGGRRKLARALRHQFALGVEKQGGRQGTLAQLCAPVLNLLGIPAETVPLMLVDSAGGGGLARAVAFIGVAILVLIVGYFSPLPPKTGDEK